MLRFYYSLGEEIISLKAESRWGSGFYKKLSSDLQKEIPNVKGLSVTNLKYMKKFYEMYSPLNRPQLVDDLRISQSSGNFDKIFSIPWGYQRYITNNLPALQSDLANEMTRIANDSLTDLTVM